MSFKNSSVYTTSLAKVNFSRFQVKKLNKHQKGQQTPPDLQQQVKYDYIWWEPRGGRKWMMEPVRRSLIRTTGAEEGRRSLANRWMRCSPLHRAVLQTVTERHNITATHGEIDRRQEHRGKDKRNGRVLIYELTEAGGFTRLVQPVKRRLVKQNDQTAIHPKNTCRLLKKNTGVNWCSKHSILH